MSWRVWSQQGIGMHMELCVEKKMGSWTKGKLFYSGYWTVKFQSFKKEGIIQLVMFELWTVKKVTVWPEGLFQFVMLQDWRKNEGSDSLFTLQLTDTWLKRRQQSSNNKPTLQYLSIRLESRKCRLLNPNK